MKIAQVKTNPLSNFILKGNILAQSSNLDIINDVVSFGQKFDHANISHECNQCAMENRLINFEEQNDNSHAAPLDSTFMLSLPQVCIWYIWCVIATLTAVFVCGVLLNKSEAPWDAFHFCI